MYAIQQYTQTHSMLYATVFRKTVLRRRTHIVQEWDQNIISMTKDSVGKSNLTFEGQKLRTKSPSSLQWAHGNSNSHFRIYPRYIRDCDYEFHSKTIKLFLAHAKHINSCRMWSWSNFSFKWSFKWLRKVCDGLGLLSIICQIKERDSLANFHKKLINCDKIRKVYRIIFENWVEQIF